MTSVRHGLVRWQLFLLAGLLTSAAARAREFDESSVQGRLRRDVTYLASDACEGRGVATQGINLAADYIAAEFRKAGLKPGGVRGGYFQPFVMPGGVLETPPRLVLTGPLGQRVELTAGRDYEPMGLSSSGRLRDAALVFAGYGLSGTREAGYDDYADVDVEGKVVVVLRETPRDGSPSNPFRQNSLENWMLALEKVRNADRHRAAAVLFVNDRQDAADGDDLLNFSYLATVVPEHSDRRAVKLPVFQLRRQVADMLLQSSLGSTLRRREEDIDRDLRPRSADLAGWSASLDLQVGRSLSVKNVVGYLDGAGPLAQETIAIGAHYDHLGYGGRGGMSGQRRPAIHHGADDNGSGSAALMELARRFARLPNRQGRRLVFVAFSGEEMALYGSVHYCEHPLFPIAGTAAMVNLDMVGRLTRDPETGKDRLIAEGTGTARNFNELLDRVNARHGFQLKRVASGLGPSDHDSFCKVGVPVLFFWTGDHADYHRPSDTAERINVAGMERVLDLAADVVQDLAAEPQRPVYVKLTGAAPPVRPRDMPRLGIRPSYTDDKEGVLVGGVTDGGPASRGGIKEGDRILELAGRPVKSLQGYMSVLASQKRGAEIEVILLRDGKRVTLKVTPE